MAKPKHKKFSGVAFSQKQVDNDIKAVLFYVEGDPKSGVIRPYIERPRQLSKAEQRWADAKA